MASQETGLGRMSMSALTFALLATNAEARCGADTQRPTTPAEITRCITVETKPSFAQGMGVGAIDLLKQWGFSIGDSTIEHPRWGKVTLDPKTTQGVWSWHRDKPSAAGELPSIRIFVKNTDGSLTILDMFKVGDTLHHSVQKVTMPSVGSFTK